MDKNKILRGIPKVDEVLKIAGADGPKYTRAVRKVLDGLREQVLAGEVEEIPDKKDLLALIDAALAADAPGLRRVINATGIVLHTNLGRAPLAEAVAEFVKQVALGYNNLEYDLESGKRGSRMSAVERQLTELCGCEAALCVNNNAAAVLLVLSALCEGTRVIVSRGELVEIGGSFRVPEIISQGGAKLVEVGTTNKVRLADYERVCDFGTGAILKVHTSNYRIVGYTQECGLEELSGLAKKEGMPLIYDLGGGALTRLSASEPTVQEAYAQGADVLCFSGDKLLGGPQAGIIIGKKHYIDTIRKHPLYRALRLDKLSLAALQGTLQLYADGLLDDVPTLAMLGASPEALKTKAERLLEMLDRDCAEVVQTFGQAGGGSLPGEELPSYAVAISAEVMPLQALEAALRGHDTPIITRIHKEKLLLDVRTIADDEFEIVASALRNIREG